MSYVAAKWQSPTYSKHLCSAISRKWKTNCTNKWVSKAWISDSRWLLFRCIAIKGGRDSVSRGVIKDPESKLPSTSELSHVSPIISARVRSLVRTAPKRPMVFQKYYKLVPRTQQVYHEETGRLHRARRILDYWPKIKIWWKKSSAYRHQHEE